MPKSPPPNGQTNGQDDPENDPKSIRPNDLRDGQNNGHDFL